MISSTEHFKDLPGGLRILEGLADYRAGRRGINACLVRIAAPRLEKVGLMSPSAAPDGTAELELYEILMTEAGNAYGRYNSLLRELVSFEHALDHHLSAGKSNHY
jgi:hypothetical protein